MTIVKGSLRIVWRKKIETISIIFLIIVVVVSYGSLVVLSDNMSEHAYRQFRSSLGDIALFGLFPDNISTYFENITGVKSVTPLYVWYGTISLGEENYPVSLADKRYVDRLTVFQLSGRFPSNDSEAIFYTSITGGPMDQDTILDIGDNITMVYFPPEGRPESVKLKIVGVAKGFAHIGGMDYALIVDENLMDRVLGDVVTGVGILLYDDRLEEIDYIAERAIQVVEDENFFLFFKFINKKERNPVVVLLESASTILTIPISVILFLVPVLVASAGSALVIREVKIVATLKSMGMGRSGVFKYYGFPWLVRGAIGLAIGLVLVPRVSEYIYREFLVRDSEIADILINSLGFIVKLDTLFTIVSYIVILIFIGALVPWLIATKVDIVRAISSTGLYSMSTPYRGGLGFVKIRIFIRDVISRPWKLVGLILSISILWGSIAALNMEASGLNDVYILYQEEMDFDTSFTVSTTSFILFKDLIDISVEVLNDREGVEGYAIFDRMITINLFGLNEVGQLITLVEGDPSVAFPLVKGRYPNGYREVVISRNFAAYKGVDIGDYIDVYIDEEVFNVEIVGISFSRLNNGYYLLVDKDQYARMLHIEVEEIGKREQIIYVDLEDGIDVELFSEEVKEAYENNYPVSVEYVTKEDLLDRLSMINNFIVGLNNGILFAIFLASLISLSSIYLVDLEAKTKELSIMKALGFPDSMVALGNIIQILLMILPSSIPSLFIGVFLADLISRSGAQAIGYLEPSRPLEALLDANVAFIFLIVIGVVYVVNLIKLRKMNVVKVIAEI